ncbi:MAG TPA: site-2 protease family protein [Tepidisphaeraceae bacterium]|jgi:Zn-dependent protease
MFGKAFRLPFRLAGIPLYVDVSFLVVLPVMALGATQYLDRLVRLPMLGLDPEAFRGPVALLLGLFSAIGLFCSVILHELGHSIVAIRYGVKVRRITLWFLGGVAEFEEMPRQRGAEAVVAIAGPLVSFALAALFWLLTSAIVPHRAQSAWLVCFYLASVNLMLGLFNLIPAMPMDGGRILRSLLAMRMPRARATMIAGNVAKVIAIGLGVFGLFYNWWLILLAVFIFTAVRSETQQDVVTDLLKDLGVADLMTRNVVTVPASMTLGELSTYVISQHHQSFPVVDDQGRLIGTVGIETMRRARPDTPIWQVMSSQIQTVSEHASALDAFGRMARTESPRLVVLDDGGQMVGIISQADLMRAIQVRLSGFQAVNAPPPTPVQAQRVAIFSRSPTVGPSGYTEAHDADRDSERYARPL